MAVIHRCLFCRRLVWPWQRSGWNAVGGRVVWWHLECWFLEHPEWRNP